MKPPPINRSNEGAFLFVASYECRQAEIYANTAHQAKQWAAGHFKPPKHKQHLVHVMLSEKSDAGT